MSIFLTSVLILLQKHCFFATTMMIFFFFFLIEDGGRTVVKWQQRSCPVLHMCFEYEYEVHYRKLCECTVHKLECVYFHWHVLFWKDCDFLYRADFRFGIRCEHLCRILLCWIYKILCFKWTLLFCGGDKMAASKHVHVEKTFRCSPLFVVVYEIKFTRKSL